MRYTLYVDESGATGGLGEVPRLWYFVLGAVAVADSLAATQSDAFASLVGRHSERFGNKSTEIHSSELVGGRGQYALWAPEARKALLTDVFDFIHRMDVYLFVSVVDTESLEFYLDTAETEEEYSRIPAMWRRPFRLMALEALLVRFERFLDNRSAHGGVVIDERQGRLNIQDDQNFNSVLSQHRLRRIQRPLRFGQSKERFGLQVADICAYSVWNCLERGQDELLRKIEPKIYKDEHTSDGIVVIKAPTPYTPPEH